MGELRAHHHLQTQGVTWVGACRIGAPCRLSSGMRQGLTHTGRGGLDSAPPPVPPGRQRLAAGGGGAWGRGPGEETLYILHSSPWCCEHRWPGGHCTVGRAPQGSLRRGPQDSRTHTHTQSCLSIRPSVPGLRPGPGGPSGRQHATSSTGGAGIRSHIGGGSAYRPVALHVRGPPLPGGAGGSRSWANTESSPEELELGVSWPPGEYCSKGTDRSRYSCGWAAVNAVCPPPPSAGAGAGQHSHPWTSQ